MLIKEGGLTEYYRKQDRQGKPLESRPFSDDDFVFAQQLQAQVESLLNDCKISLRIEGMSCMGCVWLVKQICLRQAGVVDVRVSLVSNTLNLSWNPGAFSLVALGKALLTFGYRITTDKGRAMLSPLLTRALLCTVFGLNVAFLRVFDIHIAAFQELDMLVDLLYLLCFMLSSYTGLVVFLVPAWRAIQIRKLHPDSAPTLILLAAGLYCLYEIVIQRNLTWFGGVFYLLCPVFLFARWLAEKLSFQDTSSGHT